MPRVLIDALAEQDVAKIAEYIGETNCSPDAARRLLSLLDFKFQIYASQPRSGQARPDLGADVRIFTHGQYVVVYRALDDGIDVLRVFHGAQDFPRLFRGGQP
jgi:toxin ParE1/3/4